jgi:hypothetical protein
MEYEVEGGERKSIWGKKELKSRVILPKKINP